MFYSRWRMLENSLTFQLSSLAPLKGKKKHENLDPRKKSDKQNVNQWRY